MRTPTYWTRNERVTQDLIIAEVDRARWAVPVPVGFHAECWTGTAPEPLVAGYARARTAIRDAPSGRSSYQHPDWTVQRVRACEAAIRARGCELRTVVAVHEAILTRARST
jgi:mycothiol synthase